MEMPKVQGKETNISPKLYFSIREFKIIAGGVFSHVRNERLFGSVCLAGSHQCHLLVSKALILMPNKQLLEK